MIDLDANILIRSVLGVRVPSLLGVYGGSVEFLAPEDTFLEAERQIPVILHKRGQRFEHALATLEATSGVVARVDPAAYAPFEAAARRRLFRRDEDDWPVLATALAAKCPIWTEDRDFFGCGVATWTTDRIDIFLEELGS